MSNQGIKITSVLIILLLLTNCSENLIERNRKFKNASINVIGQSNYDSITKRCMDTIVMWKINSVYGSIDTTYNTTFLDSLLCFNTKKNRVITCILIQHTGENRRAISDGMDYLFGEKINKQWYFFTGGSFVIPRTMAKEHKNLAQPLSYGELHEIALKEIYSGYLNGNGEINESWFTYHFENAAFGIFENQPSQDWILKGKRFSNKKDFFEYMHLLRSHSIWSRRDTTQPVKRVGENQIFY
jgi:hypothetical protein